MLSLNFDSATEYTISSGVITPTKSFIKVAGEGGAADTLTTIIGGVEGDILWMLPSSPSQSITIDHGAVNIVTADGNDYTIPSNGIVQLCHDGTNWRVIGTGETLIAHASTHTDGTDDIQSATAGQKGLMTAAYASKLDDIEADADVTIDAINGVAAKGTIADADVFAGADSEDSYNLKKWAWNTIKAKLDTLYSAVGAIFGSTGGTDNRLLRSDGTGGKTVQATGITVDDSDNVSGVAALSATSVSVGSKVQFPATQVPSADANALDDYEEGFHEATLTCGTSGTITLNTSNDTLAYTKVGRKVTVSGSLAVSSVSSPTGNLVVSLPFAAATVSETAYTSVAFVQYGGIVALGTPGSLSAIVSGGNALASIYEATTTGNLTDVAAHIQAGSEIRICLAYFTD